MLQTTRLYSKKSLFFIREKKQKRMKKKFFIILTFIGLANYANGQDCSKSFEDYYSSIDTTDRPVFKSVEKKPEISDGKFFAKMLQSQLFDSLFNSLQCCPLKVWIRLVVEADGTLTNIQVCTKMMFCDDNIIDIETEKFNNRITNLFNNIKSAPGELNGRKVAVTCTLPVHFDCR